MKTPLNILGTFLGTFFLISCGNSNDQSTTQESSENAVAEVEQSIDKVMLPDLDSILAAQDDDAKARYGYRHPKETLEFFGIEPGMTVLEALPGGGWYSKILLPYLGTEGKLIGVDYSIEMWKEFSWVDDKFLAERAAWPAKWAGDAKTWSGEGGAQASAYTFTDLPASLDGSVDAVLFIRALHNLSRFEKQGNYLTEVLAASHRLLRTGGLVGIVQHQVSEDKSNEWADGSKGYLKKSNLVAAVTAAGFELVGESDINANPKDQPGEEDIVWRLPPVLNTSKDDATAKAKYMAIGESNRMTLLFKKVK